MSRLLLGFAIIALAACASAPKTVGDASKQIPFERCATIEKKRITGDETLKGEVQIQFMVDPKGYVSNVRILRNSTGNSRIERCLTGLIYSTDFPAPGGTEPVVNMHLLELTP